MASVRIVCDKRSVLAWSVRIPTQYARYAREASICEPFPCKARSWVQIHSSAAKKRKTDHQVMVGIGVFVRCTKIFRFATGEPAHRWLSLKYEPSHLTVQSSILTDCAKNKRTPTRSVLWRGIRL